MVKALTTPKNRRRDSRGPSQLPPKEWGYLIRRPELDEAEHLAEELDAVEED